MTHETYNSQLMVGMYICPFSCEGNLIRIFGQKFKEMASLIRVYDPLIKAWLATIAAKVARIIPAGKNHAGIMV